MSNSVWEKQSQYPPAATQRNAIAKINNIGENTGPNTDISRWNVLSKNTEWQVLEK